MHVCWTLRLERHLSEFRPYIARVFTLLAFELICHPDHRAVDRGPIIAGQVHETGFDDEAAEFNQVPRPFSALDLPRSHVIACPCRLMPVARRPVALDRRQRCGQVLMQIAATALERTPRRASPKPPSSRHPRFPLARSARPPVR